MILKERNDSYLIDVRTERELFTVGVPDLEGLGNGVTFIEWSQSIFENTKRLFVEKFRLKFGKKRQGIFIFICKSGIRSNLAALSVEESVESGNDDMRFINVIDGFEGQSNYQYSENGESGWKSMGMPWKSLVG